MQTLPLSLSHDEQENKVLFSKIVCKLGKEKLVKHTENRFFSVTFD